MKGNKVETIEEYINTLPERLKSDEVPGWNSVFHFEVSGDDSGEWTIKIANGKCTVTKGKIGTAKCTVKTSDKTYIALETGKLNPQQAFIMGKVTISDLGEMMKYAGAFRKLKE